MNMKKTALAVAIAMATLSMSGCGQSSDRKVLRDKYTSAETCAKDWGKAKCEQSQERHYSSGGGGFFFMSPYYYDGYRSNTALSPINHSSGSTTPIKSGLVPSSSKAPVMAPKSGFSSSSGVKTGGFGKSGGSFSSFGG